MENRKDIEHLQHVIAQRIRILRKSAGLTQEQLSDITELGSKYLSRLESGKALPSLMAIVTLAKALGVEPAELIGGLTSDARKARGERITAALSGLDEYDAAFLEDELLDWVAHLKSKK